MSIIDGTGGLPSGQVPEGAEQQNNLKQPVNIGGSGVIVPVRFIPAPATVLASKVTDLLKTVKPINPVTNKVSPTTVPQPVYNVSAAQVPLAVQAKTVSQITVTFSRNPADLSYDHVNIWVLGYNGNKNWVEYANATASPANFTLESNDETVQVAVQAASFSSQVSAPVPSCPSVHVTLSGVVSAPPAPTIDQSLIPTPTGYQFSFYQVLLPAGTQEVVQGYNIYRNTTNSTTGAKVVHTFIHSATLGGQPIEFQDVKADGVTYYFWVSCVNTAGFESVLEPAQSGAVVPNPPIAGAGAMVVSAPVTVNNQIGGGDLLTAFVQGNTVPLTGPIEFDVQLVSGSYVAVLLYASQTSSKPNGYLFRLASPSGQVPGTIYRSTAGVYTAIGTAQTSNNSANLTGWHHVAVVVSSARTQAGLQFDIFVDGTWSYTAVDSTYTPTGATYYACQTVNGSLLAPSALIQKTTDHIPDGLLFIRGICGTQPGEGILSNGTFSNANLAGWVVGAGQYTNTNVTAPTSYAFPASNSPITGSTSLEMVCTANGNGVTSLHAWAAVAGEQFKIAGWVYSTGSATAGQIAIEYFNGAGTYVGSTVASTTVINTWQYVSAISTAPANTAYIVFVLSSSFAGSATIYFTSIQAWKVRNSNLVTPILNNGCVTTTANILTQSGTTQTINVASFTVQYGFGTVSYNSGSINPGSYGIFDVYFSDPTYTGSAVTYIALGGSGAISPAYASDGYVIIGGITTSSAGGGAGGGGSGGARSCFTPDTRVKTLRGDVAFSDLKVGDSVLTAKGKWIPVKCIFSTYYAGQVANVGCGRATINHPLLVQSEWIPAGQYISDQWEYAGQVMCLCTASDEPEENWQSPTTEHSFTLANGQCVHNNSIF